MKLSSVAFDPYFASFSTTSYISERVVSLALEPYFVFMQRQSFS